MAAAYPRQAARTQVSLPPPFRELLTTISPASNATRVSAAGSVARAVGGMGDRRAQVDVARREPPVDHRRVGEGDHRLGDPDEGRPCRPAAASMSSAARGGRRPTPRPPCARAGLDHELLEAVQRFGQALGCARSYVRTERPRAPRRGRSAPCPRRRSARACRPPTPVPERALTSPSVPGGSRGSSRRPSGESRSGRVRAPVDHVDRRMAGRSRSRSPRGHRSPGFEHELGRRAPGPATRAPRRAVSRRR